MKLKRTLLLGALLLVSVLVLSACTGIAPQAAAPSTGGEQAAAGEPVTITWAFWGSPEEAASHDFTPDEEAVVSSVAKGHIFGSPETVEAGLTDLIERTGADELIISTMVYDQSDRLKSYELVSNIAL